MLTYSAAIKVELRMVPYDMCRPFHGLSMMAGYIRCNPFSSHPLELYHRRSDCIKILYSDRDGWASWHKRLEAGMFNFRLWGQNEKRLQPGNCHFFWRGSI